MFDAPQSQLLVLLQSILLGAAVGLYYDLLRAPRRFFRLGRGGVALLDGLFWIGVLAALFAFSLRAAAGQSRYYVLAGCGLGALLYFFLISPLVLSLLTGALKALSWAWGRALDMARTVQNFVIGLQLDKKIRNFTKKIAKASSIFRRKGIK